MSSAAVTVKADQKFLRRIFLALVGFTLIAGALAGFATVQAMSSSATACEINCAQ